MRAFVSRHQRATTVKKRPKEKKYVQIYFSTCFLRFFFSFSSYRISFMLAHCLCTFNEPPKLENFLAPLTTAKVKMKLINIYFHKSILRVFFTPFSYDCLRHVIRTHKSPFFFLLNYVFEIFLPLFRERRSWKKLWLWGTRSWLFTSLCYRSIKYIVFMLYGLLPSFFLFALPSSCPDPLLSPCISLRPMYTYYIHIRVSHI